MYLLFVYILIFSFFFSIMFGSKFGYFISYINTFFIFLDLIIISYILYEVVFCHFNCYVKIFNWLYFDNININFEIYFDFVSVIMSFIIIFISFCVHLFSISYMYNDPNYNKFFSYLTLFTFFMILLVLSINFVQFFFGWEGVGLASYLLINFWYQRFEANRSGLKALILNKIGDISLYCAIFLIFFQFNSFDMFLLKNLILSIPFNYIIVCGISINYINLISVCLIIAAVGKSAQIGLHVWLPDAMEGPTPVSALLHAATMVTAGVYLLIRCSWIFEYSSLSLYFIIIFGILTTFFTSTIGMLQYDIKKIIAYSTASQLGYMFACCGVSNYVGSFYHLFNHAFFKALLFLCAGSIIHVLNGRQDIRKINYLLYFLPITYITLCIAVLSLVGFPFTSGFYSKDLLVEYTISNNFAINIFLFYFASCSVFFTFFYNFRLLYLIFWSFDSKKFNYKNTFFESDYYILIPLIILGFFSIFSGYLFYEIFNDFGYYYILDSIYVNLTGDSIFLLEYLEFNKLNLLFFGFFGILLGYKFDRFFQQNFLFFESYKGYFFFNKKWLFDNFYFFFTSYTFMMIYNYFWKILDKGFLELVSTFFVQLFFKLSITLNELQIGFIHFFIFCFIFCCILILYCYILIIFSLITYAYMLWFINLMIVLNEIYYFKKNGKIS